MLVVREVFHCKPGKVRGLVEKFQAVNNASEKLGLGSARLMTDLSGERFWTVVSEWEVESLQAFEDLMRKSMESKELAEVMKGYHDYIDHGRREVFTIVS